MAGGLELHSKAVSPERLDPPDHERGAENCRSQHYAKWGKRVIPARWKRCQPRLHELQLVHDLREIIAGLGSLAKGEALGV